MKKTSRNNTKNKKNLTKTISKAIYKNSKKRSQRKKAAADKVLRHKELALKNHSIIATTQKEHTEQEQPVPAPSPVLEVKPKAPSKPEDKRRLNSASFYSKKAFYYYLSIVLCMVIMESHRFSLYFEDESSEYPALSYVSDAIKNAGDITGINDAMKALGDYIGELSEAQIIDADKPLDEQWQAVIAYYKDVLGIKPDTKPQEKEIASTDKKEEKPQKKVQQPSKSTDKKEPSTQQAVEEKTEKVIPEEIHYAFYEPQNIIPAPTKLALDEYTTLLPDFGMKKKILLVGDSMMQGLVPLIQNALKHRKDLEIVHRVKVSTGLANQRFFHWPENLKKLLKQHNPHVVIVFIGANDPQDLQVQKKWYRVNTDAWSEVYSMRTINFLELATSENRKVVWIGLPIMLKEPYARNIKAINKVFKEVNSFYPAAAFVDTQMLLTDKGKFISFITGKNNKTVRIRAKDNIHLTFAGGRVITNYMIPTLNERIGASRLDDVGGNPLIPVAGKANIITFTSQIQKKPVQYVAFLPNPQPQNDSPTVANMTSSPDSSEWTPFVGTAQATAMPSSHAPANILAIQKNTQNPLAVEKLIAESLQRTDAPQTKDKKTQKTQKDFPVLYLLHGAASNGQDWNLHMGKELQKIADEKGVIIVAPTTQEYSWYVNSTLQKSSQIENFVVKELVPHVDALLPTNGKRAIAGLSMGGHGALLLSLKHPKTFVSAASASGVLDIRLHPEQWNIDKVLGKYAQNKASWNKNSVAYVLERKNARNIPKQILITTGLQDSAVLKDNQSVKKLMEKKKFKFEYEEAEGEHNWQFWTEQFAKLLRKQADFLNL